MCNIWSGYKMTRLMFPQEMCNAFSFICRLVISLYSLYYFYTLHPRVFQWFPDVEYDARPGRPVMFLFMMLYALIGFSKVKLQTAQRCEKKTKTIKIVE